MRADVFTLFPQAFDWYLSQVHIRNAVELGHEFRLTNYRDHTPLSHLQVDDTPYGGGAGMVLRIDVVCAALEAVFSGDAAARAGRAPRRRAHPQGAAARRRPRRRAGRPGPRRCSAAATRASTSA